MKTGIFLLLFLPRIAPAQDIALLDRDFKKPITITQALAAKQLTQNRFPVYTTDLDSVIWVLEELAQRIRSANAPEEMMQLIPVGHSQFAIMTGPEGNAAAYTVYLSTRVENVGASLAVVERGTGHKRAEQELLIFLDYLKNNRPIMEK